MRCKKCSNDLTQVISEIPIWYFNTRGPIVCDKCGNENPYEEQARINSMKARVEQFYKSNPDFGHQSNGGGNHRGGSKRRRR